MRRKLFYLSVALLAFAVGLFFAAKFYWARSIDSITADVLFVQEEIIFACPLLPDGDERILNLADDENSAVIITNANLRGIKLHKIDFKNAVITNSDFSETELSKANFFGAKIIYSSFIQSNLSRTNFTDAIIRASDLTGANLNGANLSGANLTYSDLSKATLKNAKLENVNFSDARLENAIGLTYEQLENSVINEFTTLPPHLELQRNELLKNSHKTLERMKQKMPKDKFESYFRSF